MKMTSKISALLLAVSLTACLQARATMYTETVNGIDREIVGAGETYTGTFTLAGLSGFSTGDTISSIVIQLTMLNAEGNPVYLTVNGVQQVKNDSYTPQTLNYTMTGPGVGSQDNYIISQFISGGKFTYTAYADCELENAALVVTTTGTTGNNSPVPDMATTVILLGSSLLGLEVLRRKFVPAKA